MKCTAEQLIQTLIDSHSHWCAAQARVPGSSPLDRLSIADTCVIETGTQGDAFAHQLFLHSVRSDSTESKLRTPAPEQAIHNGNACRITPP